MGITRAPISIRDAAPADVPAVAALLGELGHPAPWADVGPRRAALRATAESVLVAARDGDVIGPLAIHCSAVHSSR